MRYLLPVLLMMGCGEAVPVGDRIPQGQSASMKAPPPPPKPPPPPEVVAEAEKLAAEYYYNPAGKRDPFLSFINRDGGSGGVGDTDAPPLQRYDVDKFVLKGVIWKTESPRALIIDPDRTGHVVKMGTYVGRNWGKVTSISDQCIVVTEEYQTLDGELVVNPVTLCFQEKGAKGASAKK